MTQLKTMNLVELEPGELEQFEGGISWLPYLVLAGIVGDFAMGVHDGLNEARAERC